MSTVGIIKIVAVVGSEVEIDVTEPISGTTRKHRLPTGRALRYGYILDSREGADIPSVKIENGLPKLAEADE